MRSWSSLLWPATLLALVAAPFAARAAQTRFKIPEPEIERAWVLDEQGLRQWAEYKPPRCPTCQGTKATECQHCKEIEYPVCGECELEKRAPCRSCAGTGRVYDPLVELTCPYCWGSAWYVCALCKGRGSFGIQGGGERKQKCGGCKGAGGFACIACGGERRIPVLAIKKGPGEASLKDLRKARALLQETLDELEGLETHDRQSKVSKAYGKTLTPAKRTLPVLVDAQALLKESLKAVSKGAAYVGYEEWVGNEFVVFKDRTVYLLKHQILLLDICIERAEYNEKVLADKR